MDVATTSRCSRADYEEQLFPLSSSSRAEKWRKQLKLSTLSVLYDKVEEVKKKDEESTAEHVSSSWAVLEQEARETTRENMENYFHDTVILGTSDARKSISCI